MGSDNLVDAQHLTETLLHSFQSQKALAEKALAQVNDEDFLRPFEGETDPVAITVKHVGGNLRSRWREFLTSDGEKPDRHRDREFELEPGDTRASIEAVWQAGWAELVGTLESLAPEDWARTVTIRGEPHSVPQAALRSLGHTSYHVGQIVQMCRRRAGTGWQTLSIPKNKSEEFRVNPTTYLNPHPGDPGAH